MVLKQEKKVIGLATERKISLSPIFVSDQAKQFCPKKDIDLFIYLIKIFESRFGTND